MSILSIRQSLENGVNSMSPALSTAWENRKFTPIEGTPYQEVFIKFATPDNNEYGSYYRELGYVQINLMYPVGVGTNIVSSRAVLVRTVFARGKTFTKDGVTTVINRTPDIRDGFVENDRYKLIIRIPFYSNL